MDNKSRSQMVSISGLGPGGSRIGNLHCFMLSFSSPSPGKKWQLWPDDPKYGGVDAVKQHYEISSATVVLQENSQGGMKPISLNDIVSKSIPPSSNDFVFGQNGSTTYYSFQISCFLFKRALFRLLPPTTQEQNTIIYVATHQRVRIISLFCLYLFLHILCISSLVPKPGYIASGGRNNALLKQMQLIWKLQYCNQPKHNYPTRGIYDLLERDMQQ